MYLVFWSKDPTPHTKSMNALDSEKNVKITAPYCICTSEVLLCQIAALENKPVHFTQLYVF
jgi:hypothetical protein